MTNVAVCICTYRRPEQLARALQALKAATIPPGTEIVLVDNDPSGMRPIVSGLDITYVQEPTPGIASARNRAVASTAADLVAFIDDDDTVQPDWLVKLLERQSQTGADMVFGTWVTDILPVTHSDREGPRSFERSKRLWGVELPAGMATCNVLISRRAFELVGQPPFATKFARGSDTEFFVRAAKAGATWAVADESIINRDLSDRATTLKMLRHGFTQGRSQLKSACLHGGPANVVVPRRRSLGKLTRIVSRQILPYSVKIKPELFPGVVKLKRRERLGRFRFLHRVGFYTALVWR